jgi:dihydroneopterin triphosphate diphosphatase
MKIPRSVLVVVYCTDAHRGLHRGQPLALLIERADHPGFWQSVTGSLDREDEPLLDTCQREVLEETGIMQPLSAFEDLAITNVYQIYPEWRKRYAVGVTENTESVFALQVPSLTPIKLSPREHVAYQWLPLDEAAMQCFSWTNTKAIQALKVKLG